MKNFSMNYTQTLCLIVRVILKYIDVEIDGSSEDSYESDIRPPKRQIFKTCCVPLHIGDCYAVYHTKKKKKKKITEIYYTYKI